MSAVWVRKGLICSAKTPDSRDETFAGADFAEERLLVGERQDAGGVGEKETVVALERVGGHFGGHLLVRADVIHGEGVALIGQFGQDLFGGGDGAMAEAFGDRDDEEFLGGRRFGGGGGEREEEETRQEPAEQGRCEVFHRFD